MLQYIKTIFLNYFSNITIPSLRITDVVEIAIIAFLLYQIMVWIRNTRALSLLKGVLVVIAFAAIAALFNMTTILWIIQNFAGIAVTAVIVILQPELRHAVEELGQISWLAGLLRSSDTARGRFSDQTITELVRAAQEMARVKTGALIVIAQGTPLNEYVRTGIEVDGVVTSQLLINIFEKNTPLHDGAVVIYGDRIAAATCYLPLSHNKMDKELGTRHRAAMGVSEDTDALTIIVSEETGYISTAYRGKLRRNINGAQLREQLTQLQDKPEEKKTFLPWKEKGFR